MNKVMTTDYNLAFIDLETTDLEPGPWSGEIIEVSIKVVSPVDYSLISQFSAKVTPKHIETASPFALAVNGYTPELWEDSHDLESVMLEAVEHMRDCICVGQNTAFDLKFMYAACTELGIKPTWRRRYLDLMTLAYVTVGWDIEKLSLEAVCDHLGISNLGAHAATVDVNRTIECWRELIARCPEFQG